MAKMRDMMSGMISSGAVARTMAAAPAAASPALNSRPAPVNPPDGTGDETEAQRKRKAQSQGLGTIVSGDGESLGG